MTRRDVEKLGWFFLLSAIPVSILMVEQFRSPISAWINKGVGGDEGGQLFGADGRIRPPGPFPFITGPQLYFPICAAFFLDQIAGHGRMKWPLLLGSGAAILIALPVSISRTVMLATGIVGVVFVLALPFQGLSLGKFVRPLIALAAVGIGATQLPVFKEGSTVFQMRWETAASATEGDGWADVSIRTVSTLTNPFYYALEADVFGRGIGVGSNVGAKLLTGQRGFLLAEEEYGKIFQELGLPVGAAFIGLRLAICVALGVTAWKALRQRRNSLPLLLFSAALVPIAYGQWAPPTVLGFAVIGAGLVLAAANESASRSTATPISVINDTVGMDDSHAGRLPTPSSHRPPAVIKSLP